MQVSVRISDRVILQTGQSLGALDGCVIEDVDDATAALIATAAATRNGGIVLTSDHATVTALPVPQATLDAEAAAVAEAALNASAMSVLDTLRSTPIDPVKLDANLTLAKNGLVAIVDPPAADITALAAYLAVATPTLVQTAAANKAMIRVLSQYALVVTTQRAVIGVLADTIRYMLR